MRTLVCAVLALAVAAAGCTSTTSGRAAGGLSTLSPGSGTAAGQRGSPGPTSFPSSSIPRSPVPTSSVATGSLATGSRSPAASGAAGSGRLSRSAVVAALLSTAETGAGFTRTTVDLRPTPGPCQRAGSPTVEDVVPSTARAGAAFRGGARAFVVEVLTVYPDDATAQRALVLGAQGLSCAKGALHDTDGTSTPATITSSGTDTAFETVAVDEVRGWKVTTSGATLGLIVARMGNALAALQLEVGQGAYPAGLRNGAVIVAAALRKIKAAE